MWILGDYLLTWPGCSKYAFGLLLAGLGFVFCSSFKEFLHGCVGGDLDNGAVELRLVLFGCKCTATSLSLAFVHVQILSWCDMINMAWWLALTCCDCCRVCEGLDYGHILTCCRILGAHLLV